MRLFKKIKKEAGWLAMRHQNGGIAVACIKRGSATAPLVELVAFKANGNDSPQVSLESLARSVNSKHYPRSLLLGWDEYQLLSVDAPNVPADELKAAMRWRLKDLLDFHIDDATIDVIDIPVDKASTARARSMYAVAARNQIIEQHQRSFAAVKIPLSVIDIPEMAQRNISTLFEPAGRGVAMLSFGSTGGLFTVTHEGELYSSRRIDVTLAQLFESEGVRKTELFERVTLELQRSLDYFDRQFNFVTLVKLLLAPLGDTPSGLQEYLAANLYLPVEAVDLKTVLNLSKVPKLSSMDVQQKYFMVLGAALRHEGKAL